MSALDYLIAGLIALVIGLLLTLSNIDNTLLATLGLLMIIIGVVMYLTSNLPNRT